MEECKWDGMMRAALLGTLTPFIATSAPAARCTNAPPACMTCHRLLQLHGTPTPAGVPSSYAAPPHPGRPRQTRTWCPPAAAPAWPPAPAQRQTAAAPRGSRHPTPPAGWASVGAEPCSNHGSDTTAREQPVACCLCCPVLFLPAAAPPPASPSPRTPASSGPGQQCPRG